MAVQGVLPFTMAGSEAAYLVVAGAPAGSTDLEIANELTGALSGGSPDVAQMER